MNRDQIKTFLTLVGTSATDEQGPWVNARCPFAPWRHEKGTDNNPSFGLKESQGSSRAYCFSCGFHGEAADVVLELRGYLGQTPKGSKYDLKTAMAMAMVEGGGSLLPSIILDDASLPKDHTKPLMAFPEALIKKWPDAWDVHDAREYLKSRYVPKTVSDRLDLRWDANERRICFLRRDFHGVLYGIHGRAVDKSVKMKYRMYRWDTHTNSRVWFGEDHVDFDKPVVFAESVFDLASLFRVYRNVVTPLSATVPVAKLERMADAYFIITVFDADLAGNRAREKVDSVMGSHRHIRHIILPQGTDAGNLTIMHCAMLLDDFVTLDKFLAH